MISHTQPWFISKQYQSFAACTTSPLPALSNNIILQHLLARGIIVDTNTNHVPFTTLPASQPLMTFPVTSRNAHTCTCNAGARVNTQTGQQQQQKNPSTTRQTSSDHGRREGVAEHHDDVKNDLLIIHYHPALLMR